MSLGSLLSQLNALTKLHQFAHWKTQGTTFFGDHLLFERLYDETSDLIDSVAEKSIGLFGPDSIEMVQDTQATSKLLAGWKELRTEHSLPSVALKAVKDVITDTADLQSGLEKDQKLTGGLSNLLEGIQDKLESHIYLLHQRTAAEPTNPPCPKCREKMHYDDGRDAYVCCCGFKGPNGPIHTATLHQISKRAGDVPEDHIIEELKRLHKEKQRKQQDDHPRVYIEEEEDAPCKDEETKDYDPKVDFEIRLSRLSAIKDAMKKCAEEDDLWRAQPTTQVAGKPSKWSGWFEVKARSPYMMILRRHFKRRGVAVGKDNFLASIAFNFANDSALKADFDVLSPQTKFLEELVFTRKGRGPDTDRFVSQVVKEADEWIKQNKKLASTLTRLLKVAYHCDQAQLYAEADRIDQLIETLAKRVGLALTDYVSAANFMDELGQTEAANTLDALIQRKAGIVSYQPELQNAPEPKRKSKGKDKEDVPEHLEVQPLVSRMNEKVWKQLMKEVAKEEGKITPEDEQEQWKRLMPETLKELERLKSK